MKSATKFAQKIPPNVDITGGELMSLDLEASVNLLRKLQKNEKLLKKQGVLEEYDGVLLGMAANAIEDGLKHPDKDMFAIHGENPHLAWLILSAFRYSVGRHITEAMWGIEGVIVDNLHLLCDNFIQQMIDDIENEFRVYELQNQNNKRVYGNPYYLKRLQDKCIKEMEARNEK